jgi:glucose/arabinose dehydrogenase
MNRLLRRAAAGTTLLLALLAASAVTAAAQQVDGQEPNRGGTVDLSAIDPAVALQRLHAAPGYRVELFASERDFPVGNPVALAFDGRSRLWVATAPSYPHYKPGDPPRDKLVILEDTDGDGRADRHTVFADSLYLALGFELGDGGVYVAQQPNLVFLKDTNGDGRADHREVILHGFGTEDSHHAIHAFTWGPDGALYFQEGTFHHSQVETPHGPVRVENGAVFRYEPHTAKLSVFTSYPYANPWGHVFDRWGQNFIADASDGSNYFALPISGHLPYPVKQRRAQVFTSRIRPTGGAEIVSSRHFPDDAQGNFLVSNVIGFHGILAHRVGDEGSGFTSTEAGALLWSSDINFRPIDMEFGPDGALYVVDWFNPLIGHMQYSMRDPRRDHSHGRIWRITYEGRPLLPRVDLERLTIDELVAQLATPEDRTRYRVRRELRVRDREEVRAALTRWTAGLDPAAPDYEHLLLETLWVQQGREIVDPALLERLLDARDPRARAAATRVLRYTMDPANAPLERLRARVADPHPRVRLEAVVALSHVPSAEAAEVALEALRQPVDGYLDFGLSATVTALESYWRPRLASGAPFAADNPEGLLFLMERLTPGEVARVARTPQVTRELLLRGATPREVRREALREVVAERRGSWTREALDAIRTLEAGERMDGGVAGVAELLVEAEPRELRAHRAALQALALRSPTPAARQAGYAALMRADGGVEHAWRLATRSPGGTVDLLDAVARVEDPALRQALYPRVRDLLRRTRAEGGAEGAVRGRYVRVEKPGCCVTLTLAEVEVFDGTENIARGGRASQKSTAMGGEAARAIDGNTAGEFQLGSVSQTSLLEQDPWWEVDLGETRPIDAIRVWARTDEQIGGDLAGFHLRVLDTDRRTVWERERNAAPRTATFAVGEESTVRIRRAAVRAMAALDGHEAERIALFADLLRQGVDGDLAIAGAAPLVGDAANGHDLAALAEGVVAHAAAIPAADRGGPSFTAATRLAGSLRERLDAGAAARLDARLQALQPKSVRITAVVAAMRFDIEEFTAAPGQEVEIVLENPDYMPHNLVVTAPGRGRGGRPRGRRDGDAAGRLREGLRPRPPGGARRHRIDQRRGADDPALPRPRGARRLPVRLHLPRPLDHDARGHARPCTGMSRAATFTPGPRR